MESGTSQGQHLIKKDKSVGQKGYFSFFFRILIEANSTVNESSTWRGIIQLFRRPNRSTSGAHRTLRPHGRARSPTNQMVGYTRR